MSFTVEDGDNEIKMFKIILGLFAAENLIFAILISLQTGMTYSRRSDVAYKGYAGNVFSCLEVMA